MLAEDWNKSSRSSAPGTAVGRSRPSMDVSNAPVIPPRKFSKSSKIVAKERWVVGVRPSVWIEPDA